MVERPANGRTPTTSYSYRRDFCVAVPPGQYESAVVEIIIGKRQSELDFPGFGLSWESPTDVRGHGAKKVRMLAPRVRAQPSKCLVNGENDRLEYEVSGARR